MRVQGRIIEWNDLRGFGFVSPIERGERVFLHISAFPRGSRRPTNGAHISYTVGADERGRLCATQADYIGSHARPSADSRQTSQDAWFAGFVSTAFLGVVTLLAIVGQLWWAVPAVYFVTSITAYFAYQHDKWAAQAGARRTGEGTLIILGLIGGWPGALVARHRFRHKTAKLSFRIGYWLSVLVNIAGLAWLASLAQL